MKVAALFNLGERLFVSFESFFTQLCFLNILSSNRNHFSMTSGIEQYPFLFPIFRYGVFELDAEYKSAVIIHRIFSVKDSQDSCLQACQRNLFTQPRFF